jgi:GDP-L-fucose synthase
MNANDWPRRRVLVTGAHGFLGGFLIERLEARNAAALLQPTHADLDLLDRAKIESYLAKHHPDLVIHAAAVVGGIGANRLQPGRFFYENAIMGIELIEACRRAGVDKFVCIGTTCAYPKFTPVPFSEDDLWNGYPEETNAPYGVAKRALHVQLTAYREQHGFNGIYLIPANLYGPSDHFDVESGHVIPAMIAKFSKAVAEGHGEVELWGDGSPTREFLYVEDAADAIVLATERYDDADPVNIATGEEISIRDLAKRIAELTGFTGTIRWDETLPNGQPRRRLDTTRAKSAFGFTATVGLEEGLRRTVEWYSNERARTNAED